MPQNHLTLGFNAQAVLTKDMLAELDKELTRAVEVGFGIVGENDVACTVIPAIYIRGETDVQVEIRYTAGTDEYNRGEVFNPSEDEQEKLAETIKIIFENFLERQLIRGLSISVWCKPYYNSVFKA